MQVLVPLDGSTLAESVLPIAADLTRRTAGKLRLLRVHVPAVPLATVGDLSAPFYDPAWDEELRAISTAYLGTIAARLRKTLGPAVSTVVADNPSVADQIEESADEFDADLVVMTTHGHGGSSLAWFGSVADQVIRHSHRLTLVVPERTTDAPFEPTRVLVATDGSRTAEFAMDAAAEFAGVYKAELALVQVVAPPLSGDMLRAMSSEGVDRFDVDALVQNAKKALDAAADGLRATGHTVTATVIVEAHVARALLEYIAQTSPDVVVMGTHGRGLSRLVVGSVGDKVMRGCGKPALIMRAPSHADR